MVRLRSLRGALALIALGTGCGRLEFASTPPDATPDTSVSAHGCNSVARIADDFEDGADAYRRWLASFADPGTSFSEAGGDVVLTLATDTASAFTGYQTDRYYDLRGERLWTEIIQFPDPSAEVGLSVNYGGGTYLHLAIELGQMRVTQNVGGVYSVLASTAYDPSERFIGIREEAGQLYFETSPDGVTFVPFYMTAPPFDVSLVRISLYAGTSPALTAPGVARFASINGGVRQDIPGCGVSTLVDTFEDGVMDHRWARTFTNPCCTQSETGGGLVLTSDGTTGYVGRRSAAGYSLREDAVVFTVPSGPTAGSPVFADVGLRDADNRLALQIRAGMLGCWVDRAGIADYQFYPRQAGEVHFRIRHTAGQIYFEASVDGASWRIVRELAEPFAIDDLDVGLEAGTSTAGTPSTVTYDDLGVP